MNPELQGSVSGFRQFCYHRVLRGRDSLLHECVPFVALRTLPEQFGAAVSASHADVWIQIEHRAPREFHVTTNERRLEAERRERKPDLLVNDEAVRVVRQRLEEQFERLAVLRGARQVS